MPTDAGLTDPRHAQQRPAESDRVASEFPDGAQHIPSTEQRARSRTHERQDTIYSEMKAIAQDYPDRVSAEHTTTAGITTVLDHIRDWIRKRCCPSRARLPDIDAAS